MQGLVVRHFDVLAARFVARLLGLATNNHTRAIESGNYHARAFAKEGRGELARLTMANWLRAEGGEDLHGLPAADAETLVAIGLGPERPQTGKRAPRLAAPAQSARDTRSSGDRNQKKRSVYVKRTPRPISGARSLMNEEWLR